MKFPRHSGVLLHPTSLPGPHGSGDLGAEGRELALDAGVPLAELRDGIRRGNGLGGRVRDGGGGRRGNNF